VADTTGNYLNSVHPGPSDAPVRALFLEAFKLLKNHIERCSVYGVKLSFIFLSFFFFACGATPARMAPRDLPIDVNEQVTRAEKAADEAKQSAELCRSESASLRAELKELRSMLSTCQSQEKNCGVLAVRAERRIAAQAEEMKRKAQEEAAKTAAEADGGSAGGKGKAPAYSRSDAPR
jgi:hypothetical protein